MLSAQDAIAARLAEFDAIRAELAAVKAQLEAALVERDTAKADAAHYRYYYTRTGW